MEPSPARTPLVPPAGVTPQGTVPVPSPMLDEATPLPPQPFADELPPDFWGDALEPPDTLQAAPDEAGALGTSPQHTAKPLSGTLQDDPRFRLLQDLFPGRISSWQSAETPLSAAQGDTDDAPDPPETVSLEAGLDSDDTDLNS